MTQLEKLYSIADRNQIAVLDTCPPKLVSISVRFSDGSMLISSSDLSMAPIGTTKLECFAHELGHCMTGSFYNLYSPFDIRAQHEFRANKWAINKLIPFSELLKAGKAGCRERHEFAEYFNVSESFIQKAVDYHASQGNFLPHDDHTT